MSRLIDAEPLDCLAWKDGEHGTTFDDGVRWVLEKIGELPTIEPERKKGKWINNSPVTMKCDQCGYVIKDWRWAELNFCANCGADMRGEQDE